MEYTPEYFLPTGNQIMVFGANREYRHGLGAALFARQKCGAIYGKGGLQGNSYALVTKELRKDYPPVTLDEVSNNIIDFMLFAETRLDLKFYVTKIGTKLAGFTLKEIGDIFRALNPKLSPNIILPKEFC